MEEKIKIGKFTDLIVWQKSMEVFETVVKDTETFPRTQSAIVITNQIIRSCSSISANIAEGFGRGGQNEYKFHLGIAKGSATESQDWYCKIGKLKYLPDETVRKRIEILTEIIKMLNTLISIIGKSSLKV